LIISLHIGRFDLLRDARRLAAVRDVAAGTADNHVLIPVSDRRTRVAAALGRAVLVVGLRIERRWPATHSARDLAVPDPIG
jgi:hypothetical protein